MNGMSPQLQNQIAQYQQVQQQLQTVSSQKMQFDAQKREIDRTIADLTASTGDVYRSSGSLLIKVDDKAALETELKDASETLEVRIASLERQEKTLQEKFKALTDQINASMGRARPASKSDDDEEDEE